MSGHADFDENASNRTFTAPYTSSHPIPTVQRYHEGQQHRKEVERNSSISQKERIEGQEFYTSHNRNAEGSIHSDVNPEKEDRGQDTGSKDEGDGGTQRDTQQTAMSTQDPRQKRKDMKHMKRDHARQVTDPVTHLPQVCSMKAISGSC